MEIQLIVYAQNDTSENPRMENSIIIICIKISCMEQRQNMSVSTRGAVHYERVSNVS